MTTATVNNLTIGYDVIGDGEPMLLVMGLATQRIFWHDDFVKLLASEGFQVIRVDNRDIGESTHLDAPAPTRGQLVKALAHRRFAKAAYLARRHGRRRGGAARPPRHRPGPRGRRVDGRDDRPVAGDRASRAGAIADLDHVEHGKSPLRPRAPPH